MPSPCWRLHPVLDRGLTRVFEQASGERFGRRFDQLPAAGEAFLLPGQHAQHRQRPRFGVAAAQRTVRAVRLRAIANPPRVGEDQRRAERDGERLRIAPKRRMGLTLPVPREARPGPASIRLAARSETVGSPRAWASRAPLRGREAALWETEGVTWTATAHPTSSPPPGRRTMSCGIDRNGLEDRAGNHEARPAPIAQKSSILDQKTVTSVTPLQPLDLRVTVVLGRRAALRCKPLARRYLRRVTVLFLKDQMSSRL